MREISPRRPQAITLLAPGEGGLGMPGRVALRVHWRGPISTLGTEGREAEGSRWPNPQEETRLPEAEFRLWH